MVNAFIKECPVVRHKNEPSFALEIFRNESSPVKIKMIRRFVNEQKIVFLEKECGKQQFGFFSVGKRCKRTGEHTFINTEKSEFPLGAHDDGPDALEGARTLARKGSAPLNLAGLHL